MSKLHAWFERNDEGTYFIVDAGSHNGTGLRGQLLPPRTATHVERGDTIHFGSVETTFCAAADLWDMLAEPE